MRFLPEIGFDHEEVHVALLVSNRYRAGHISRNIRSMMEFKRTCTSPLMLHYYSSWIGG